MDTEILIVIENGTISQVLSNTYVNIRILDQDVKDVFDRYKKAKECHPPNEICLITAEKIKSLIY